MNSYKDPGNISKRGFLHSVNAALEGVVHTLMHERNMRVHFLVGFLVLIGGIYLNLEALEFLALLFAVAFVLAAEMFNTAIEYCVDLINDEYHPLAKIIKDIAAGAVFVGAVNALVTGYILFTKIVGLDFSMAADRIKQSPWHITFIILLVVIGMVLLIKVMRRERFLLRGGMPSGHSAVAFAVWVVVSLMTENCIVSLLVLLLALYVARSRRVNGIHTVWEIIAGGALGALVALTLFQLLS